MKNAYSILGIQQNATKQDVIRGQILAMKEKKYPPREIAIAQKQLTSPVQRLGVDFIYLNLKIAPIDMLATRIKSVEIDLSTIDPNAFDSLR
jgi:hypothetical protein